MYLIVWRSRCRYRTVCPINNTESTTPAMEAIQQDWKDCCYTKKSLQEQLDGFSDVKGSCYPVSHQEDEKTRVEQTVETSCFQIQLGFCY